MSRIQILQQIRNFAINKARQCWLSMRYPRLIEAFRVESHLTFDERVKLYKLSQELSSVAEIGSYLGASACCCGAAMKLHQSRHGTGRIFCIDTWQNEGMAEGLRDTWQEFTNNTSNYQEFIVPIRGLSTEVVGEVESHTSSLDLLFIDGDHSYEGVKADWNAYNQFLKPGSFIVFHDSGWAEGVKRVIREDVEPMVSSSDSLPNMWWGILA